MTYVRRIAARVNVAHAGDDMLPKRFVAILKHFLDTPHTLEDFKFTLVDKIPVLSGVPLALRGPLRRRQELLWMDRLRVDLNKNTNWIHSFPGALDKPRARRM